MQTRMIWLLLLLTWGLSAKPTPPTQVGTAQVGTASWYGERYHGRQTASGELFDMHQLTAAHRALPFGSLVRVTDNLTGRAVTVRINDRGPFVGGRVLDLSHAAAQELGMVQSGLAEVRIERLLRSGVDEAAGSASTVVAERFRPGSSQTEPGLEASLPVESNWLVGAGLWDHARGSPPGTPAPVWSTGVSDQTLETSASGRERLQTEEEPAVGADNGGGRVRSAVSGSELTDQGAISGASTSGFSAIHRRWCHEWAQRPNETMTADWRAPVGEEAARPIST